MNEADKLKAMRELNWRARYIKYKETGENKGLLQDNNGNDADFDKAFEMMNLEHGLRVIDIGCGYGNLTLQLAKKGNDVTGIDISVFIINEARSKASTINVDCTFEAHDFLFFETEKKFDVITDRGFITVLHKPDKLAAINKMQNLLNTSGYVFMKVDKNQLRKNFLSKEELSACFDILHEWDTSYIRSDGKPIPANFFILQKK